MTELWNTILISSIASIVSIFSLSIEEDPLNPNKTQTLSPPSFPPNETNERDYYINDIVEAKTFEKDSKILNKVSFEVVSIPTEEKDISVGNLPIMEK